MEGNDLKQQQLCDDNKEEIKCIFLCEVSRPGR